jgi:hypothetical protein
MWGVCSAVHCSGCRRHCPCVLLESRSKFTNLPPPPPPITIDATSGRDLNLGPLQYEARKTATIDSCLSCIVVMPVIGRANIQAQNEPQIPQGFFYRKGSIKVYNCQYEERKTGGRKSKWHLSIHRKIKQQKRISFGTVYTKPFGSPGGACVSHCGIPYTLPKSSAARIQCLPCSTCMKCCEVTVAVYIARTTVPYERCSSFRFELCPWWWWYICHRHMSELKWSCRDFVSYIKFVHYCWYF